MAAEFHPPTGSIVWTDSRLMTDSGRVVALVTGKNTVPGFSARTYLIVLADPHRPFGTAIQTSITKWNSVWSPSHAT